MNALHNAISARREAENWIDTADIIEQAFEHRVEQIGMDAACLELIDSDYCDQAPVQLATKALRVGLRLKGKT
jgi:hypothetical protein